MMTIGDVMDDKHGRKPIRRYWMGTEPERCNICMEPFDEVFVDGATVNGPWMMLCPKCHKVFGKGLGVGRGQQYTLGEQRRWWKTGG